MSKQYTIKVSVDYPWVGHDDVFEILAEINENEIAEIVRGGIRILYEDRCETTVEEYVEAFSESAYARLNAIAEKVASEKWGEKMLIANGARYEYFLPDDIKHAIFGSNEARCIYKKRIEHKQLSQHRFHEDSALLHTNYSNGRWKGRLVPDPLWNNQYFGGVWHGSAVFGEENYSVYDLHCQIMVEGNILEIGYSIKYCLEYIRFNLCVYDYNYNVFRRFEDILGREGYSVRGRGCGCIYIHETYSELFDPTKYVKTYMNVLDEVIKLSAR